MKFALTTTAASASSPAAYDPTTEYHCHLGANSSKERNNRKGANARDSRTTALALQAKEQADSKRNGKLLKNLKIHSVGSTGSLLAVCMAGLFTDYLGGVFVLA